MLQDAELSLLQGALESSQARCLATQVRVRVAPRSMRASVAARTTLARTQASLELEMQELQYSLDNGELVPGRVVDLREVAAADASAHDTWDAVSGVAGDFERKLAQLTGALENANVALASVSADKAAATAALAANEHKLEEARLQASRYRIAAEAASARSKLDREASAAIVASQHVFADVIAGKDARIAQLERELAAASDPLLCTTADPSSIDLLRLRSAAAAANSGPDSRDGTRCITSGRRRVGSSVGGSSRSSGARLSAGPSPSHVSGGAGVAYGPEASGGGCGMGPSRVAALVALVGSCDAEAVFTAPGRVWSDKALKSKAQFDAMNAKYNNDAAAAAAVGELPS